MDHSKIITWQWMIVSFTFTKSGYNTPLVFGQIRVPPPLPPD